MNRRNFFAFLPLAPIVAVGSVEAQAKPDNSAGAPRDDEFRLSLQANKKSKPINNGFINGFQMNETDLNRQVTMAVGEDGNLWIKSLKGQWKKVATE